MITIESTESIARPALDVFAFVSDVRNDPRWHTDVLEAKLSKGRRWQRKRNAGFHANLKRVLESNR